MRTFLYPDWTALRGHVAEDSLAVVEGTLRRATSEKMAFLGAADSNRFHDHAERLLHALSTDDLHLCQQAVERLAGLGVGLTPAGDDFLMGVLYALWALWPEAEARRWGQTIASTAAPLTTTLSAGWLRAAARGEASAMWHELVAALADDEACAIRQAAEQILATGHTSGAAALAGFVAASQALVDTAH